MKITIFEDDYNEKGQYFIDEENMVWMHGTVLADRLGFKNPSEAITKHTDEDERRKEELNGRLVWFVSEPGIWGMILASKTPEALEFKRDLKHKILPKLRASAFVLLANATSEQTAAARLELDKRDEEIAQLKALVGEKNKSIENMIKMSHPKKLCSPEHVHEQLAKWVSENFIITNNIDDDWVKEKEFYAFFKDSGIYESLKKSQFGWNYSDFKKDLKKASHLFGWKPCITPGRYLHGLRFK